MTTLRSGDAVVQVVAEEGAVAESFVVAGVSVLARTDRTGAPAAPHDAPADEDAWVRAWRGGWQLCLPSAGGGAGAGSFHGRASQTPWRIESATDAAVVVAWEGDGLRARREWRLSPDELVARTVVENVGTRPVPFAPAEHLVLGDALLGGGPDDGPTVAPGVAVARVSADARATVARLDDDAAPAGEPVAWPGSAEDPWSVVGEGRARLAVLTPPPDGAIAVSVRRGTAVAEVGWDSAELPHAVLWQEIAATSAPPWNRRIRALGIEPTVVPHGAGSVVPGGLPELAPGAVARWSCALRVREAAA